MSVIADELKSSFIVGAYRFENTKEFTSNFQKNFIKYLVMHPGTTALNIKGWVQASTMQSFSDMIQATLYGGGAFISDVVGGKTTANVYRNKSKQLLHAKN